MALSRENTTRITDLLRKNPQGLSITDIVKKIDINRNTAGRYLESLLISGQVEMRHFGMAKIYTASHRVPISAMLSISSDFVMQLDSSLRIVFANEPFLNLLRVTPADLFGKNIEYSAAVPVFEDELENFIALLKTGIAGKEWHGTLLLGKGDRFFSCHVTPVVFNDGRKGVSVRLEELTELRHREIALQESEARLRSIISAAPIGIGVVSNRVILEVNERLCQMTGYQAGELIGKPARILYTTEEEYDAVGREKYELIDQTGAGTVQTQWQKKNGAIIDILLSSAPLDPADLMRGVTFTALDITQRTRAEQALRESEGRYRKLVEISPDAVILHRDGKIIYANPAARTLVGAFHPEEMVGKSVLDFIGPGFRESVSQNIQKDLGGELSPQMELQMLRLDGTSVTVEGRGVRTLIGGKPAVMVTIRDTTERKRAEEDLFNSRQMLQLVLDTIPVRVFWKDRDSVYLGCNRPLALDAGYASTGELIGKTDYETTFASTADLYRADDREVMSIGSPKINYEETQNRPDGSRSWLRTSKVPLRNKAGDVIGILGTYEDITEQKTKEDALIASEERYRRLLEQLFDAVVIHKEGKIVVVNEAALAIAGAQSPEDLIGRSIYDFIHPDSRKIVKNRIALLENGKTMALSCIPEKFIRMDGRTVDVEVMATRFDDKGIPAIQMVFREISNRSE
jgi:PAS domain S-box-containing protein